MRLKVKLSNQNQAIELPVNYHQILQGLIYHLLERDLSFQNFLHQEGYTYQKRKFKAFTYSRLFGRSEFNRKKKTLVFHGPITWYISSAIPQFIELFGQAILLNDHIRLFQTQVQVDELQYEREVPIIKECIRIKMLSPVTIYSTYQDADGKKYTQYFNPYDAAFVPLIKENARKKYEAFYHESPSSGFHVKPIKVTKNDKVVTKYKNTIINAWSGTYALEGSTKLLKFLYNSGIGGKNSQGFGMFKILPLEEP